MANNQPVKDTWDVVIVGTGMGGGTIGYSLAKSGMKVLFLEKGKSHLSNNESIKGNFAESFFDKPGPPSKDDAEILARAGRWKDIIEDRSTPRCRHIIPFIGSGTGGSSALYGMALERFHPSDFRPAENYREAIGANLPNKWPITYEELEPFYTQAETLYGVRGTEDPLHPAPPASLRKTTAMNPSASEVFERLQAQGLHPYRLPSSCERKPGCLGCQSFLCPHECKNDSSRICVMPALSEYGAELIDECRVVRIEADSVHAKTLVCQKNGEDIRINAKLIILAAGALETPSILLRSTSKDWPNGLANQSGLVGRCLMRHYIDLYLITPKNKKGLNSGLKEIAFNDFYIKGNEKLGTVQSFGLLPPPKVITATIEYDLRHGPMPWIAHLFRLGKPFVNAFLSYKFRNSLILASIMEDLPYTSNRVHPKKADTSLILEYHISDFDSDRIRRFRQLLSKCLKPFNPMRIEQAENNERIAHVCGSCRFGTDPKTSVLNHINKAHDLENLYIIDSSFFPTSGGTNPALTIAANALRVAQAINEQQASK